MDFVIDNRERALIQLFNGHEGVSYRNLDYGDCLITWDGEERMVIERKTLEDLASSIKDGRYSEQKARLFQWRGEAASRRRIVYIIEGVRPTGKHACINGIPASTLLSSMVSMTFRDDIALFMTKDVVDTHALLERIFCKFQKEPDTYFNIGNASSGAYIEAVKLKKNKNMTPDNVLLYQLAQIPGISHKIAQAIHSHHPTMYHLITHLMSLADTKERLQYVTNLRIGGETTRRVGPKTAQTILNFLQLPSHENSTCTM